MNKTKKVDVLSTKLNKAYADIQKEEASTWLIDDPIKRREKAQRETIRYPYLAKQMGLNALDTSNMIVWDIGAGPLGGVSSVLNCKIRCCFDPLAKEYGKYFDTSNYVDRQGEEMSDELDLPDLVIITNALDHFENPKNFIYKLVDHMKPGAYFAQFHAIDNAITHPHPAHVHNVNPGWLHNLIDEDFETCWELKYPEVRYGWVNYQGKVGQPAFCGLYRKVTGYGK